MKGDVTPSQGQLPQRTHNRDEAAKESVGKVAGASQVEPSHIAEGSRQYLQVLGVAKKIT